MVMASAAHFANQIDEIYAPGFVDEATNESVWLSLNINGRPLFTRIGPRGGQAYNWRARSAGQTAEIYTEGQAAPAAGSQTYQNAQVAPTWFRIMTQWTGHLEAAQNNRADLINFIGEEFNLAKADLFTLINQTFMGATESGVLVIVDATTNYAGINRAASPAWWASSETPLGGVLTQAALEDLSEDMRAVAKTGVLGLSICAPNQMTNYGRIPGVTGAANSASRRDIETNASGHGVDISVQPQLNNFQGAPVLEVPGFSTSVWLMLDVRPGMWGLYEHQPFMTEFQGRQNDSNVFHHKVALAQIGFRPKRHAKLTGITV